MTKEEIISKLVIELREELKSYEFVYITDQELEEWEVYDSPRIWDVDKHDYHNEYAIISIKDGNLRTLCLSEGYDGERNFSLEEITIDELIQLR